MSEQYLFSFRPKSNIAKTLLPNLTYTKIIENNIFEGMT